MAKKEETVKIVLERTYNVPLRKEFLKAAKWRRTEKAKSALKEFISQHMKSDDVRISGFVNEKLWKHGIKNPPHHIKISAKKDDKGLVRVELAELPGYAKRRIQKQDLLKKAAEKSVKDKENDKKKELEDQKINDAKKSKDPPKSDSIHDASKGTDNSKDRAVLEEKEKLKELKKEIPKQPLKPIVVPKKVEQRPTAPKSQ
jgi:large subunit ribosomal protein L31e